MDKTKSKDDEGKREEWLSMHVSLPVTLHASNISADVTAGKCINLVFM